MRIWKMAYLSYLLVGSGVAWAEDPIPSDSIYLKCTTRATNLNGAGTLSQLSPDFYSFSPSDQTVEW